MGKTHNPEEDSLFEFLEPHFIPSDLEFHTIVVGGEEAAAMLQYNVEPKPGQDATNRKSSKTREEDYAAEMLKDQWYLSAEPVIFTVPNDKGRIELINGQNRLKAIKKAALVRPDIKVPLTVCLNAPHKMMWVLDRGNPRKPADFMRMAGHANATDLSRATRMLWSIEELQPFRSISLWRNIKLAPEAEADFLDKHIELVQGLKIARDARSLVRPHVSAVLWYLMQQQYGPFKAAEFLGGLATGEDISDARLKVREFLSRRKWEKYPWDGFELLGLLITAVNAWLLGDEKYRAGSAFSKTATKFPRLIPRDQLPDSKFTRVDMANLNDESLTDGTLPGI